jgi:hypothetical protein
MPIFSLRNHATQSGGGLFNGNGHLVMRQGTRFRGNTASSIRNQAGNIAFDRALMQQFWAEHGLDEPRDLNSQLESIGGSTYYHLPTPVRSGRPGLLCDRANPHNTPWHSARICAGRLLDPRVALHRGAAAMVQPRASDARTALPSPC